jgi:tetratricopeptide (TPR) repeat protein
VVGRPTKGQANMQNSSGSGDATPQAQSESAFLAETATGSPHSANAQFNLAKALMESGRYDECLGPLDRAIDLSPSEALFYLMKADVLAFLGRNHEAVAMADYALALSQSSRADLQVPALLVKGHAERAIGQLDNALAVYGAALSLSPENASVLVSRGAVLHDLGRLQEALADFDYATAQNSEDPMAWYDRGNALKDLSRYDEALDSYRRATSISPEFAQAWNNAATLLYHQERYADAIDYAEHATRSNPRLDNSWYVKGRALLALQRREEARAAFDQAISLDQGYLQSVQALLASSGSVQEPHSNSVAGETALASMLAEGPTVPGEPSVPLVPTSAASSAPEPVASAAPGDELSLLDHVAAVNIPYASAQYAVADPVNPLDPAGWYMKSLALYRLSRFQEALIADDYGLYRSARDRHLWNLRGLIFHALHRDLEAISCFDYAIALDPGLALAYDNEATVYLVQGNVLEAVPLLEQATRLDPGNAYGWSNLGYALYALQKPEQALEAFERAISLSPATAGIYNNRGAALRALGRIDEALVSYNQALSMDGTIAVARENRAHALQAAGRDPKSEARQSHLSPPGSR